MWQRFTTPAPISLMRCLPCAPPDIPREEGKKRRGGGKGGGKLLNFYEVP